MTYWMVNSWLCIEIKNLASALFQDKTEKCIQYTVNFFFVNSNTVLNFFQVKNVVSSSLTLCEVQWMCHLEIWKNVGDENNILGGKRQRPILHKRDMSHENSGIAFIFVKEKFTNFNEVHIYFRPVGSSLIMRWWYMEHTKWKQRK